VQLSWIGYVGTTGLQAMDYVVADGFHVPVGAERDFTERVLRLPHDYVCFEPPQSAPPVAPLPALKTGRVTFGSFNNPAKVNASVLELWGEVLRRVPDSRLLLKYGAWDSHMARARVLSVLKTCGINADRIEFRGASSRERMLQAYGDVDVALDPFPYSGGLTTCEALWMGVPVVTLPGETFASRHSFSHLQNAGQSDLIASTAEAYVEIAAHLAADLPALADRRAGLRAAVARSPLCDRERYLRDWTVAMRGVWKDAVARSPSPVALV
jgi:protein O-GlcNAc transferase